jgi:hypothetical protein
MRKLPNYAKNRTNHVRGPTYAERVGQSIRVAIREETIPRSCVCSSGTHPYPYSNTSPSITLKETTPSYIREKVRERLSDGFSRDYYGKKSC